MKYKTILLLLIIVVSSCANPKPRRPILERGATQLKESVNFNRSLINSEEKLFKTLMKKDSLRDYIVSSQGFWYYYNFKSEMNYKPSPGDKLFYNYEIQDLDYNLIYDEAEIGDQTYVVDQQELLEGLRNGLKLMNEGDIMTFLFPSHKVYGYTGDQRKIGINQPLIYKVQLNKINKKNESN